MPCLPAIACLPCPLHLFLLCFVMASLQFFNSFPCTIFLFLFLFCSCFQIASYIISRKLTLLPATNRPCSFPILGVTINIHILGVQVFLIDCKKNKLTRDNSLSFPESDPVAVFFLFSFFFFHFLAAIFHSSFKEPEVCHFKPIVSGR